MENRWAEHRNHPFILLIHIKILWILKFMSRINFSLSWVEHEKSFITSGSQLTSVSGEWSGLVVRVSDSGTSASGKHACQKVCVMCTHYIAKLGLQVYTYFSYFLSKTEIVGSRRNNLSKVVLTYKHNLCFEQKYLKHQKKKKFQQNFQSLQLKKILCKFLWMGL